MDSVGVGELPDAAEYGDEGSNTVGNIVLATAIINLPFYIRVARAEANVRRGAGFIEAARLSGNGDVRILAVHLFPNILPPAMVQVSLNMGWAILNAAGLSFIGLGVRPPTPEWGILVAEGAREDEGDVDVLLREPARQPVARGPESAADVRRELPPEHKYIH